jgi:hypothetical protein
LEKPSLGGPRHYQGIGPYTSLGYERVNNFPIIALHMPIFAAKYHDNFNLRCEALSHREDLIQ